MKLIYFDTLRATAIIFIVAAHCLIKKNMDTLPEMMLFNLLSGNTAIFVFISGFFFHYKFYHEFNYRKFMIKKINAIFIPYFILTVTGFFVIVVYLKSPHKFLVRELNGYEDIIILLSQYLWKGRVLIGYWYIPFIMMVFLLSPIFIRYIELPMNRKLILFFIFLCLSTFIHRPEKNLSVIHSVLYFLPIYMLGIIFSQKKDLIFRWIDNKSVYLGLLTIFISFSQVTLYKNIGNFTKVKLFSYDGIDIIIFQKIAMIFFLLSCFRKIEYQHIKILGFIATISFAIYFIHPWLLFFYSHFSLSKHIDFLPGIAIFLIKFTAIFSGSIGISLILKSVLRNKSKYIIGW